MVLCDDDAMHSRGCCSCAITAGFPGDVSFRSVEVAWKYKMSELQAAIGRVQLDRIDELIAKKSEIFGWYRDRLAGFDLQLNLERPGERATYWMVSPVFGPDTGITADLARDYLADVGIATRPFFPPLSSLPAFAGSPDSARRRSREHGGLRPGDAGHQPPVGAHARRA